MEVSIRDIIKFLLFVMILVFGTCAEEFLDSRKMSEVLDEVIEEDIARLPRQVEGRTWIWQDYEFGSGVGNREELLITDIQAWKDSTLPKNIKNWKFLEHDDEQYLAGTKDSTVLLYHFDVQTNEVIHAANVSVFESIKAFEVMSSLENEHTLLDAKRIYLILFVESNNKTNAVKWYYLHNYTFVEFRIWDLQKPIKSFEFIVLNSGYKMLLLYEDNIYFNKTFTLIQICNVKINADLEILRSCHEYLMPQTSCIEVCLLRDTSMMISLQNKNLAMLYEYKNEDFLKSTFESVQNITLDGLTNTICFENGNVHYLIALGTSPILYQLQKNEFLYNNRAENLFNEIQFIQSLPVETYRDEVVLLAKSKNLNVFVLGWQGSALKLISLPNQILNSFDLSTVTIIPKFGFVTGNTFVKFKVMLNKLPRPMEMEIERMLKTKYALENILNQQESIISKTNSMVKESYLTNNEIQGIMDLTEVTSEDLTVNGTNTFPISLGYQIFTLRELQSDYENAMELINTLQERINKTEQNLQNSVIKNTTDIYLREVDITGDLDIKGTVKVENLMIDSLNGISMDTLIKNCLKDDNAKITGIKSFPTINFTNDNLKIENINGIPLSKIKFDEVDSNYYGIDLDNITKLEIKKNLNFLNIAGTDWSNLKQNLVFKNQRKVIPGHTVVSGQVKANHLGMNSLNNLQYPSDYIVKSGPEDAHMTGEKMFETLTVSSLVDVQTINGIDADEFIILNADQKLDNLITFENIVIDESFQVDKNITGLPEQDIDPYLTLLNSNAVHSNTMFTTLLVLGKVYVENSVNGSKWSELDDLILKDEDNVTIFGKKHFLCNAHFIDSLEIKNRTINGHSIRDFITLDTEQVLPNLSAISGNVEFTEVSYEELRNLEGKITSNIDNEALPVCINKSLIFKEPPVIDEFSSFYINENITGLVFSEKLESLLANVHFENLNVKKLLVKDLQPTSINNINLQDFKARKLSKNDYQKLSGNITINYLEVNNLYTDFINNRTESDIEKAVNRINVFYDDIFNGKELVDSLNVTGTVKISQINEEDLNDIFHVNYNIESFVFKTDKSIENIVIEGLVNDVNFTKKLYDTVLKTENHVIITVPKKLKKLKTENLQVEYVNGRLVDDIISANKNQILTGPVKIKGFLNIRKFFNSTGKINDIFFKDISGTIHKLDGDIYKLNGDFLVQDDVFIKDLNAVEEIQGKNINEFMKNLIYFDEKETIITGTKIFDNAINFFNNVTIMGNINSIDLKIFYQNAVLIDHPISVITKLDFESDILLEGNLTVINNVKVSWIKEINIDDLMDSAVYLNRPTSIADVVSLSNVVFKSNITVEYWNNVKMDRLFSLKTDEFIQGPLMCVDVSVDNLEVKGLVNGENLTEVYENTFMLSADQNIIGKISFLNNIDIQDDFNTQYINNVDVTKAVSLNDVDPLIGYFVFESPIMVNDSLKVHGNFNDVHLSKWISNSITTSSLKEQIFFGNWTVYGNVDFNQNVHGCGSVNGVNMRKLVGDVEKKKKEIKLMVSNKMLSLKNLCEDLLELKNDADNMLYKFKSFDYFDTLEFNKKIVSVHHFELKNIDYIMVNYENCYLDVLKYINEGFVLATNVPNFGYVKQYITLSYEENLYFVTLGKSECGKNPGNVWSIENYQFRHILNLGNVTDMEKLGNDAFAVVVDYQVQEWYIKDIYQKKFIPTNVIPIPNENVQFFSNENDTLLASKDSIFDLRKDALEFEEFENPYSTSDIVTFQAGVYKKEYILFYEDRISSEYIFICNNDLSQRKVLQTINTRKASSFIVLNFDKFQESFLIFSENKRKVQIYEYKGIEGFKYHSSIKIKLDAMFSFQLRIHPNFTKRHCVAIVQDNKLIILKAKMYGERLDTNGQLICGTP